MAHCCILAFSSITNMSDALIVYRWSRPPEAGPLDPISFIAFWSPGLAILP